MKINFIDQTKGGIRYLYSPGSLSEISLECLRDGIDELNELSGTLGCVIFEASPNCERNLVVFAGHLERFSMLSVARGLNARVFYFQDTMSAWYGGSSMLPDIAEIASFLRPHLECRQALFFGQSSGGYAALALGALFPESDVLACSPQVFADESLKRALRGTAAGSILATPDYVMDIASMYQNAERSGVASAIFSACEADNPIQSHFWLDHFHMARLLPVGSIDVYLENTTNHSIVFQRAPLFAELLRQILGADESDLEARRDLIFNLGQSLTRKDPLPDPNVVLRYTRLLKRWFTK